MPSTPRGIVYPSSTANVRLWEHFQSMADSVDDAMDAGETWTAFTPTWNTVFSSVGAGGINEGCYSRTGDMMHVEFRVVIGTAPTIAAGTVQLQLPVAAYTGLPSGTANQVCLGSWQLRDDSGVWYYGGTVNADVANGASATFSGAWSGSTPGIRITNALPAAWAVNDSLSGNLTYRCAP